MGQLDLFDCADLIRLADGSQEGGVQRLVFERQVGSTLRSLGVNLVHFLFVPPSSAGPSVKLLVLRGTVLGCTLAPLIFNDPSPIRDLLAADSEWHFISFPYSWYQVGTQQA